MFFFKQSPRKDNDAEEDDCRICLDAISTSERGFVTPCKHSGFHATCFQAWRKACVGECRCPCCNASVKEFYVLRQVGPDEVLGERLKTNYFFKLAWSIDTALPKWYFTHLIVTSVGMSLSLLRIGGHAAAFKPIDQVLITLRLCGMFFITLHLSAAGLLYDFKHKMLSRDQFIMFLRFPWILSAGLQLWYDAHWMAIILLVHVHIMLEMAVETP